MSITLNGNVYTAAMFAGRNYLNIFPEQIFTDMLAEMGAAETVEGVAPGADGGYLKTSGGLWVRGTFAEDVQDIIGAMVAAGSGISVSYNDTTGVLTLATTGTPFYGARAGRSSVQSIPASTDTAIHFNSEEYDTSAIHDVATNPSRFTVPAGRGGKWTFRAQCGFGDTVTSGVKKSKIRKNGTTWIAEQQLGNVPICPMIACTIALVPGDYLEYYALQEHAGAPQDVVTTAERTWAEFYMVGS